MTGGLNGDDESACKYIPDSTSMVGLKANQLYNITLMSTMQSDRKLDVNNVESFWPRKPTMKTTHESPLQLMHPNRPRIGRAFSTPATYSAKRSLMYLADLYWAPTGGESLFINQCTPRMSKFVNINSLYLHICKQLEVSNHVYTFNDQTLLVKNKCFDCYTVFCLM